jgi:hypothetical protein
LVGADFVRADGEVTIGVLPPPQIESPAQLGHSDSDQLRRCLQREAPHLFDCCKPSAYLVVFRRRFLSRNPTIKINNERAAERNMRNPSEHWRKMWAYFDLKKEEFLKHYHRRSNVESTFGGLKAKFGGGVRSKKFVAQQNEVLAKVLLSAEFTRWRSPKPVGRDHRKRSMAITENGPSRSVVRPVRVQIPVRSPGDQRVPAGLTLT